MGDPITPYYCPWCIGIKKLNGIDALAQHALSKHPEQLGLEGLSPQEGRKAAVNKIRQLLTCAHMQTISNSSTAGVAGTFSPTANTSSPVVAKKPPHTPMPAQSAALVLGQEMSAQIPLTANAALARLFGMQRPAAPAAAVGSEGSVREPGGSSVPPESLFAPNTAAATAVDRLASPNTAAAAVAAPETPLPAAVAPSAAGPPLVTQSSSQQQVTCRAGQSAVPAATAVVRSEALPQAAAALATLPSLASHAVAEPAAVPAGWTSTAARLVAGYATHLTAATPTVIPTSKPTVPATVPAATAPPAKPATPAAAALSSAMHPAPPAAARAPATLGPAGVAAARLSNPDNPGSMAGLSCEVLQVLYNTLGSQACKSLHLVNKHFAAAVLQHRLRQHGRLAVCVAAMQRLIAAAEAAAAAKGEGSRQQGSALAGSEAPAQAEGSGEVVDDNALETLLPPAVVPPSNQPSFIVNATIQEGSRSFELDNIFKGNVAQNMQLHFLDSKILQGASQHGSRNSTSVCTAEANKTQVEVHVSLVVSSVEAAERVWAALTEPGKGLMYFMEKILPSSAVLCIEIKHLVPQAGGQGGDMLATRPVRFGRVKLQGKGHLC